MIFRKNILEKKIQPQWYNKRISQQHTGNFVFIISFICAFQGSIANKQNITQAKLKRGNSKFASDLIEGALHSLIHITIYHTSRK